MFLIKYYIVKRAKKIILFITILTSGFLYSQEDTAIKEESKSSYYKKRAIEDAKFEQDFKAKTKKEEKQFWKDQKAYEKDLKKRDKEAYNAYMQGKRDAYKEHQNHCTHHCNHGFYYHNHATYYYHYEYRRQPRRSTNIRIGTPRVRIGLF